MSEPLLYTRDLCKYYPALDIKSSAEIRILDHINFSLAPGESLAIVGVSGSGKSTLLHLLAGLDTPTSGEVWFMGENLRQQNEQQRCRMRNEKMGFVYQFHHLLPELSALENVALPLRIRRVNVLEAEDLAKAAIASVGLSERYHHRPGELSGGERQRIALARAIVSKPACILADEPTGNLDQHTAQLVFGQLQEQAEKQGSSIIVVTHDRQLAKRAQRVLELRQGNILSPSDAIIS